MVTAEGVLNSKPITQASDDSLDVLRPCYFLTPKVNLMAEQHHRRREVGGYKQQSTMKELKFRFLKVEECLEQF